MSPPSSPTASGYRWIIAPAIALIFCLAALSAWRHNANRAEDSIVAERLDRRASELIGKLGERFRAYEHYLVSLAGLMSVTDAISESAWRGFVSRFSPIDRYPGTRGSGFAAYLSGRDRAAHERAMRANGAPSDYRINPPGSRPEYSAITAFYPQNAGNVGLLGRDVLTIPNRREPMLIARDTGMAAVSEPLALMTDGATPDRTGHVAFSAVYAPRVPVETPAQRTAAGKPAQGRLTLSACHESGNIVIAIVDDGRGIVRQKVLQRAWERGLVEPGTVPEDDAILRLIFEPGFSTAEKVTNLSGRGVGMDVVRRNIEALRGSITIHSTEGQGSRMEIRLPLTLAIIDGFGVGVGSSRFIFPLDSVVEVIEHRGGGTPDASGRTFVELRGRMLPVVSLRALYALDGPEPERTSIVVLQADARRFGVRVDQLLGQHQTVIKPLGRMFRSLRGMSGSSILGNGEVALIFDVVALGRLATQPAGRSASPPTASIHAPEGQAS